MFHHFNVVGTGELIPNNADVWYYDFGPDHGYGDCIYVYDVRLKLLTLDCSVINSFICEIH